MRTIKFRGKSIFKGDWWEGFYIYSEYEKKHFIVQDAIDNQAPNGSISFAHFAEIDVKTLGQFTGLKDKKGIEIYEGDIVEVDWNDARYAKHNVEVIWNKINLCWEITGGCLTTDNNHFEVIGNIYQNPKLIKRK